MHERVADRGRWSLEQAGRGYVDRERWMICCGHLLWGHSQGEQGIRDYR